MPDCSSKSWPRRRISPARTGSLMMLSPYQPRQRALLPRGGLDGETALVVPRVRKAFARSCIAAPPSHSLLRMASSKRPGALILMQDDARVRISGDISTAVSPCAACSSLFRRVYPDRDLRKSSRTAVTAPPPPILGCRFERPSFEQRATEIRVIRGCQAHPLPIRHKLTPYHSRLLCDVATAPKESVLRQS